MYMYSRTPDSRTPDGRVSFCTAAAAPNYVGKVPVHLGARTIIAVFALNRRRAPLFFFLFTKKSAYLLNLVRRYRG